MPLYDYRCRVCGCETEVYRSVSETSIPMHCGTEMQQFHSRPPMGAVQAETHYICPATGKEITSRKKRLESFREHNLVDVSDMDSRKVLAREEKKWAEIRRLANAPVNELPTGYKAEDFLPAT